jgi:competence protein ComEC
MSRPLGGICLFFCAGILAGLFANVPFIFIYIAGWLLVVLNIAFLNRTKASTLLLYLLSFFLGVICLRNSYVLPRDHLFYFTGPGARQIRLIGTVASQTQKGKNVTTFILQNERLLLRANAYKVRGKTLVRSYSKGDFFYGDRFLLEGRLYKPPNFHGGAWDLRLNYRDYLYDRGIYSILSLKRSASIKYLGRGQVNPIKAFAFSLKRKLENMISANISPQMAGILKAMLLGQRKEVPPQINELFMRTGTVHILAVSGLHVGIAAFISLLFLKAAGIPKKLRYLLSIFILILYCVITGMRPSTVRATIMAIILLVGLLFEREPDIYNSLFVAAIVILWINPLQLLDAGFQLSFSSVFFILWLFPKIKDLIPSWMFRIRLLRYLALSLSVSLAAWLGTLGLVAYYFGVVSLVAVFANVIVVSLLPVIVASGFAFLFFGLLFPVFTPIFAQSCQFFTEGLVKLNLLLARLPFSHTYLPKLSIWPALAWYFSIFLIFGILVKRGPLGRAERIDKTCRLC